MGVVYKARDPLIGRLVALKTVMPGLLSDTDLLKRFYREAQSAGRLQHPNIVIIHDLGESDGLPYIAMEFVEGESLQKVIARQVALPLATKLTIMVQICRGLGYAHQHGLVHRDVKPANILVKPDGTVKVVDFGIVHLADTGMTSHGMILGTVSYMAPEQLRGETVDARADVFAVGAVMYELLSYRKAFEGANVTSIMFKIASGEPTPLAQIIPGIPAALDDAVRRCLRKDREDRFQTLEDLAFELEPLARKAQREVVDSLVEQGRGLLKQGDFARAEEALRSALELDSGDEAAKSLMARAQAELKSLRNPPRIKECLNEGRRWMEQGKYIEASEAFEEILRLDSHHGEARDLLSKARSALAKAEDVRTKLDAAKRALSAGDLTVAESEAHETLQIDSNQIEAALLIEKIRAERADREKRAALSGRPERAHGHPDLQAGADRARVTAPGQGKVREPSPPPPTLVLAASERGSEAGSRDVAGSNAGQRSRRFGSRALTLVATGALIAALGGVAYMAWLKTGSPNARSARATVTPAVAQAASLGAISGHVTGVSGTALGGVSVEASDASGRTLGLHSAEDGGFRFEGLTAGSYLVRAQPPPGYGAPSDVKVEVSGSQERQISLALSKLPEGAPPGAVARVAQISANKPSKTESPRREPQQIKRAAQSEAGQQADSTIQGAGGLAVSANVDGAGILIDGRDTGEVTPHVFSGLPTGAHRVTLIKDGYGTVLGEFNVTAGGSANAHLQLSVPSGVLEITTVPAGADVLIDGKSLGRSPVSATLPAGEHQWQVTLGSVTRQGTLKVPADGIAQKSVEFQQ
jgi:tetratricopeptide (TPR) repeat protein